MDVQVICSSGEATNVTQNKSFNCENVEVVISISKNLHKVTISQLTESVI
jgi:hypothetical protein